MASPDDLSPYMEYLAHRRRIIMFDEWGWYTSLSLLFTASFFQWICWIPFIAVLIYGGKCIYKSYVEFWDLEASWLPFITESLKANKDTQIVSDQKQAPLT